MFQQTEKGSKATPRFDLNDSLVLGCPNALGGNNCNLSLGIAKNQDVMFSLMNLKPVFD